MLKDEIIKENENESSFDVILQHMILNNNFNALNTETLTVNYLLKNN